MGVLLGKTFLRFRGQRKLTFCRNRNTLPGSVFSPEPMRLRDVRFMHLAADPRVARNHPALPQAAREGAPGTTPGMSPPVLPGHNWQAGRRALFRVLPASSRTVFPTAEPADACETLRRAIRGAEAGPRPVGLTAVIANPKIQTCVSRLRRCTARYQAAVLSDDLVGAR